MQKKIDFFKILKCTSTLKKTTNKITKNFLLTPFLYVPEVLNVHGYESKKNLLFLEIFFQAVKN